MNPDLLRLLGLTGSAPAPVNPNIMTNPPGPLAGRAPAPMPMPIDPLAGAARTLTNAGAQPPMTMPVAGKPATAMPDRNGSPMLPSLPMNSGEMDGYYNDSPGPTAPTSPDRMKNPMMQAAGQGLMSGLQDVVAPQTEAPRPPAAVSPPGPTVRPDMSALTQMIMQAAQRPQADPRRAGLAAMLMRG